MRQISCTTEHVDTGAARIVFNGFERRILIHELESPALGRSSWKATIEANCGALQRMHRSHSSRRAEQGCVRARFGHICGVSLTTVSKGTYFLGEIAQVSEDYRLAWR